MFSRFTPKQGLAGDDRGAVLVIVKYRNLHRLAQFFLDLEAVRGFNVFKVDAAEGRLEQLAELDDFFRIVAVDFNIEDVDVGKALEEDSFAFHNGLSCEGADVAKTENRSSIA